MRLNMRRADPLLCWHFNKQQHHYPHPTTPTPPPLLRRRDSVSVALWVLWVGGDVPHLSLIQSCSVTTALEERLGILRAEFKWCGFFKAEKKFRCWTDRTYKGRFQQMFGNLYVLHCQTSYIWAGCDFFLLLSDTSCSKRRLKYQLKEKHYWASHPCRL